MGSASMMKMRTPTAASKPLGPTTTRSLPFDPAVALLTPGTPSNPWPISASSTALSAAFSGHFDRGKVVVGGIGLFPAAAMLQPAGQSASQTRGALGELRLMIRSRSQRYAADDVSRRCHSIDTSKRGPSKGSG